VRLAEGAGGGKVATGRASGASACTVSVASVKTAATTASDKAAATAQNQRGLGDLSRSVS
jgi:hypothetical protein